MNKLQIWVVAIATSVTLSIVGVGLWAIRGYWLYIGFSVSGIALLAGIIGLVKWWYHPTVKHNSAHGMVIYHHGRMHHFAPGHHRPEVNGQANGSVTIAEVGSPSIPQISGPSIPRLGELIQQGLLCSEEEGQPTILQGIHPSGDIRYGAWPGVLGIGGMQNTGKSVTIATYAIIARLQSARVVVCDTHATKPRSLYKKLAPLEGFITFAKTEQDVSKAASDFHYELVKRKGGSEPYPYVLVIDELASLVRSDIGTNLVKVIERCSQEGQGYNMFMVLAIHNFSEDGLGDVAIRNMLNMVVCHRMQAGQSKFVDVFNTRDTKKAIAALPNGHAYIRDECNDVDVVIMPLCDVRDAMIARDELQTMLPSTMPRTPIPMRSEAAREAVGSHTLHLVDNEKNTEAAREAVGSVGSHAELDDITLALLLRQIGKRLAKGEKIEDIRKSLGATQGRASTEVNTALMALSQESEVINE